MAVPSTMWPNAPEFGVIWNSISSTVSAIVHAGRDSVAKTSQRMRWPFLRTILEFLTQFSRLLACIIKTWPSSIGFVGAHEKRSDAIVAAKRVRGAAALKTGF